MSSQGLTHEEEEEEDVEDYFNFVDQLLQIE